MRQAPADRSLPVIQVSLHLHVVQIRKQVAEQPDQQLDEVTLPAEAKSGSEPLT